MTTFPVPLRSLLAEFLKTIETIGTIFFLSLRSLLAGVLKTIETIFFLLALLASNRPRAPLCRLQASSKRANIHNRWLSSRRLRSLRSPMMRVRSSSKRANIWGMFTACFCSPSSRTSCLLCCENPQVTFASLSSPAVMDICPLRGRSPLAEFLKTIETIGTIFSLFGYLHFLYLLACSAVCSLACSAACF